MAFIKDAAAYALKNYPHTMRDELSNARLTKMIYLADWHQAINYEKQVTNIQWYFDSYGPYVNDVRNAAQNNPSIFNVANTSNIYGQLKIVMSLRDTNYSPQLSSSEKISLDHVIRETQKLYWDEFIKLVYSTYPITSSNRYSNLDLVQKAAEYRRQKRSEH